MGEEEATEDQVILWRRQDRPGHEATRLTLHDSCRHLSGTAVFANNRKPCWLDYLVICDPGWQTVSARVAGWLGNAIIEIDISVDAARRWQLNDAKCPAAHRKDLENIELHLLDTGHIALEEDGGKIADLMRSFLRKNVKS